MTTRITASHSIAINVPAEQVFAALINYAEAPRWQPAVIEERALQDGPVGVGTQIYQKRRFRGQVVESVGQIVTFEPYQRIVTASAPQKITPFSSEYLLEPAGDGTRLSFSITLELAVPRLFAPLIRRSLARDLVVRFGKLKALLEVPTPVVAPAALARG